MNVRALGTLLLLGTSFACTKPAPPPPAARSAADLVADASARIETLTAQQAIALLGDTSVAFVDLREQEELDASGKIPGAVHAPRGMLEFYVDPASRAHKAVFSSGKRIVFYCAGGGRSALATARALDMGLTNVAHIGGGFHAWVQGGGPVEQLAPAQSH
jgi:rhodanese-related sulfurtransferase